VDIRPVPLGTRRAPAPSARRRRPGSELVRRWLRAYGPASEADLKWWTGWTLTDTRRALAAGAEEVRIGPLPAFVAACDTGTEPPAEPAAALLPSLDPSAMGWADRGFHLAPELRPQLFDYSGNIGPTVWWNGEIIGGWARRSDGEPAWLLLHDRGAEAAAAVADARMAGWAKGRRFTPRFRTPLEKELTA
jgi:hypothetical protein